MHQHPTHNHHLSKHVKQRIAPVVAFEIIGTFVALTDILKAKKFKHGSRFLWLPIIFIQPIGPWLYFVLGQAKD
ncbi:PLDc N-terminal domain-containing protein [Pediococcus claussenii]|uniref:Membrane protein n=1 Tax=Pediococcus claussenii (strain ATCC BAA-344 / DSM 14800 / JCM 18046 / KCTC 3811 / LMG 21948 / P06) TaxID=701521 RepID=G8PBE6_PEDCP|nr:PLDc N-terminal domain-containing protein [Pediococcus claussenii]AEV95935.1 putative membrane protein [Pediococcus claussenii ATCC BAA-344]ANZ69425.1 hypothetical protein AYR57_03480 [Pediococcus claussenii]ANZ71245.1 hypothetical protein AYR58_03495 [Pediococcus claussenii]KRN20539.1 hypothetical protein IV79_GL000597 [Pediococcus claussenii]